MYVRQIFRYAVVYEARQLLTGSSIETTFSNELSRIKIYVRVAEVWPTSEGCHDDDDDDF